MEKIFLVKQMEKRLLEPVQHKRMIRKLKQRRQIVERISRNGSDILKSQNFRKSRDNIQHGTVSVREHCVSVAECSLTIRDTLDRIGIRSEERDLVRGALLHDYFLYDWHTHRHSGGITHMHGFTHPSTALNNAEAEYELTPREQDIIRKHMWPLTLIPPQCREAWIVTAADKYCSFLETVRIRKGKQRKEADRPASAPEKRN